MDASPTGAQVTQEAVQGILTRLDKLAEKIGTTAANVFNIYVAQAKVEAIRDLWFAGLLGLGGVICGVCAYKLWKYGIKEDDDFIGAAVFLAFVTLGLLSLSVCNVSDAIPEWFNPSYWAFQHLTQDLKNLL